MRFVSVSGEGPLVPNPPSQRWRLGRNIRRGPWRPLPPIHRQIDLGVGGHVRERELGPRDHMTCYVMARPGHVITSGPRGGGTHRVIGHVTQASSAESCAHSVY